ncbi:MAG: hypothetical protein CMF27_07660 [Kiritimatiellaceae bacterium]|nr:hypothetical protein [Kiritimatiellaceae bacterium]
MSVIVQNMSERMQLWHDHCADVAGLWEPMDWESFKRVHANSRGDWVKCIQDAAKVSHKIHCKKKENANAWKR